MKFRDLRPEFCMRQSVTLLVFAAILPSLLALGAESPDGTQHQHTVIGIDGPDALRIRYCGIPIPVRLANVQLKGAESEKLCRQYLNSVAGAGAKVKLEVEPAQLGDGTAPARVQVFAGSTHINLEMIKRGFALSDGRSEKYVVALQAAQQDAMSRKIGIWAADKQTVAAVAKPIPPVKPEVPKEKLPEVAPAEYSGIVVADLSSKEYHFPGSRYAQNIRAGARIEYKTPEEAERAGKVPSPFSFPDRAKAMEEVAAQKVAGTSASSGNIVEQSRTNYADALKFMQAARQASRNDNATANLNWKKAAKLISDSLDRLTPIADANPNDKELQKLTEEMSMSLYSCNKYQSL
jgi:endonuclease YncB( thermonuclease family)